MNLVSYEEQNSTLKLLVSEPDSKEKISHLLHALQEDREYEVTFVHIKILPLPIILRLQEIKDRVRIVVNEKKLKYYLRDLGFRINYQQQLKSSREKEKNSIKYIALGGSAGSLKKFMEIIEALPQSDISMFIVMHQRADMKSSLAQILQRKTQYYRVVEATSDIKVMPATIYIAPPNKHMIVAGGFIFLTDDAPKHFSKPSISTTFESLAYEYNERLVTILVCGYGADGSDSLEHIRKNGGLVIIEHLHECKATPMLENAINSKEFDYILSIHEINDLLKERLKKRVFLSHKLDGFLEAIHTKYGYDYRHYSKEHISRRIEYFYESIGFANFEEFQKRVLEDKSLFKDMFLDISINVTTLFRNPQTYKKLSQEIARHFKDKSSIKIWCAGCSSGEEPYSIAILLQELGVLEKSLIYATDNNDVILEQAKNGLYSKKNYKLFQKHYELSGYSSSLREYFQDYGEFVAIDAKIKKKILFFSHNLVTDGVLNEFQLIFCRNVIIYFDTLLKKRVFDLFDDALQEGGILVLGESETYDEREGFVTLDKQNRLYQKI